MEKIFFLATVLALIICGFLTWYFIRRFRHEERLVKIEKGMDPDAKQLNVRNNSSFGKKVGIVCIGISIGMLLVGILDGLGVIKQHIFILTILGLSGGISMIIANRADKNQSEK